jgi:hypothetical protein
MSGGFLRRFAGAFVEFPAEQGGGRKPSDLDSITDDAAELLAQLEHHPQPTNRPPAAWAEASPPGADGGGEPASGGGFEVMRMNADDVFRAAGIADGPNSSERILKIIAGLTMFPPEQQLVMVRAMDQADETWSESLVLEDAHARQAALQTHLQRIEDERGMRLHRLQQRIAATRAEGQSLCDDIDTRIAELQAKRQEVVVETTAAVTELEGHIHALEADTDRARRGITHVIGALSNLIPFFRGPAQ